MNRMLAIVLMLALTAIPACAQDEAASNAERDASAAAGSRDDKSDSPPGDDAQASTKPASDEKTDDAQPQEKKKVAKRYDAPPPLTIDPDKTYIATIDTTAGTMVAELWPKIAPQTVNSFVFLSREGFYEDVIFHRVIPGFMIQGGDPTGTGTGGPGYRLPAEFNETKHDRGILSMARTADPNSAGSQFFIMHARSPHLDNQYTAFGKVTQGLEVVDKIATAPTGPNDRPRDPVKIEQITIEEK